MSAEKNNKKQRTIWMKKGSYKYLLQLLQEIKREISLLRKTQRYIASGLKHQLFFDKDFIRDTACSDEIDQEILNLLRYAPASGILPRDVAREVQCDLTPWKVTLRIRRMNKKLHRQFGQKVAEKRGLHWALTSFAEAAWDG